MRNAHISLDSFKQKEDTNEKKGLKDIMRLQFFFFYIYNECK